MDATVSSGRPTALVLHDDGDALDGLIRLFEASGFEVLTAVAAFRAQALLESDRKVDVVIARWESTHALGGDVYRWALQRRYDLRDQFVFLAAFVPAEFDRIVAGRCLTVSPDRPAEVVRVALATIRRAEALEKMRDEAIAIDLDKPTLLLAEDEPMLLAIMTSLLGDLGYNVTAVESGNRAIARMELEDFDVILADWHMDDGNGESLFLWLVAHKPYLAGRVVFLSGDDNAEVGRVAPGRPMIRKGQDSGALVSVIREIVREVRGDAKDDEALDEQTIVEPAPDT